MRFHLHLAIVAAAVGFTSFSGASAQDAKGPECGTFVVTQESPTLHFLDHGNDGAGTGDQRIIRANLMDEDGNRLGTQNIVAVLLQPDEDGRHPLMATIHDEFSNGGITTLAIGYAPDTGESARPPEHELQRSVTGGTGAFAHATGTVSSRTRDDGVREYRFDIICAN